MIDDVFSLCFGSVEGDGALMLGDVDLSEQDIELRYTSLLSSLAHPHYYSVQLESLWVGDVQLPVRPVNRLLALYVYTFSDLLSVSAAAVVTTDPRIRMSSWGALRLTCTVGLQSARSIPCKPWCA